MRIRSTAPLLAVLTLLVSGCGGPAGGIGYLLEGHDPATAKRILVPPFQDTRTILPGEKIDPEAAAAAPRRAREIFLEELRATPALARHIVIAPELADSKPRTLSEITALGAKFRCDLVFSGQLFSFLEMTSSGIPPRAGVFLRVVSVPDRRAVYVGEGYETGSAGGAEGQARAASRIVLDHYVRARKPSGLRTVTPSPDAPSVLVLPYHDRRNPRNFIDETGGGAVVTAVMRMELESTGAFRVLPPPTGVGHDTDISAEEALSLGRAVGADYVLRGQVLEFRRAKSQPNIASVVISTAILAVQVILAETTGVDIAHELYRTSDGTLVYAERASSRQKYVVAAERTVRNLASTAATAMRMNVEVPPKQPAEPVIDGIEIPDALTAGDDGASPDATTVSAPAEDTETTPPAEAAGPIETETEAPEADDAGEDGEPKTTGETDDAATDAEEETATPAED